MSKEYKTKQPTQLPNLVVTQHALSEIAKSFDKARKQSMDKMEKNIHHSQTDFVKVK
jgi:hypothetical protein